MAATDLNQTHEQADVSRAAPAPSSGRPEAETSLLALRVSRIIGAHADALDLLIAGGFAPLANPVARMAMAHTVTLAQAFRIVGMDDDAEQALIGRLLQLDVDWQEV